MRLRKPESGTCFASARGGGLLHHWAAGLAPESGPGESVSLFCGVESLEAYDTLPASRQPTAATKGGSTGAKIWARRAAIYLPTSRASGFSCCNFSRSMPCCVSDSKRGAAPQPSAMPLYNCLSAFCRCPAGAPGRSTEAFPQPRSLSAALLETQLLLLGPLTATVSETNQLQILGVGLGLVLRCLPLMLTPIAS